MRRLTAHAGGRIIRSAACMHPECRCASHHVHAMIASPKRAPPLADQLQDCSADGGDTRGAAADQGVMAPAAHHGLSIPLLLYADVTLLTILLVKFHQHIPVLVHHLHAGNVKDCVTLLDCVAGMRAFWHQQSADSVCVGGGVPHPHSSNGSPCQMSSHPGTVSPVNGARSRYTW